ncbi:hypothetical protein DRQ33_02785 [bacterium]|nr:MAG: hypothetical protein DRQ33_02785 [bacterium]
MNSILAPPALCSFVPLVKGDKSRLVGIGGYHIPPQIVYLYPDKSGQNGGFIWQSDQTIPSEYVSQSHILTIGYFRTNIDFTDFI